MAGTPRQKQKVLLLLRILYERTDASHGMTLQELAHALQRYGIECERKSLYRDLEAISDAGFQVERVRTKDVRYYWADRPLTKSDGLLLTALLQTGAAVPRKRKSELVRKLLSLAPISFRRILLLPEQIIADGRSEVSERVYPNVEFLCEAIRSGVRVHFSYRGTVTEDGTMRRSETAAQTVSPYRIVWKNGYYLVAADIRKQLTFYRVDRISDLQMTQIPVLDLREAGGDLDFDLNQYLYGAFFSSEDPVRMIFRIRRDFLPVAERRLPPDASVEDDGIDFCMVACESIPEEWFGFLLCHSREICLLSPASAVRRLQVLSARAARTYPESNAAEYGINYDETGKTVDKSKKVRYNKHIK